MDKQRERARAASTFKMAEGLEYGGGKTRFDGYDTLAEDARVVALYRDGSPVDALSTGQNGVVVLDRTPFYAESGGQVGDRGELSKGGACLTLFAVHDTQKIQPEVFGHYGEVKTGELKRGDTVAAKVDGHARARAAWNHSATHLMHAALRMVLGDHVTQKGSLVDPERTRFDFSHSQPMTDVEIRTVESLVNGAIRANYPVEVRLMPYDEAIKSGAMALFGEKYGDQVRVVSVPGFSMELCGGTHVGATGDIGFFAIVAASSVAAGVRRIDRQLACGDRLSRAQGAANRSRDADHPGPRQHPGAGEGAGPAQVHARVESGRRSRGAGGGSERRTRARRDDRGRRREGAARDPRQA